MNIFHENHNKVQNYVIDEQINEAKRRKSKKSMKDRNFVEVLWNLLKMKNHTNFKDLISAFRAYQVNIYFEIIKLVFIEAAYEIVLIFIVSLNIIYFLYKVLLNHAFLLHLR